jgi:hypothetical protein
VQFGDIGQKNVLLRAGDPGDWAALFDRMGDELAPALHTVLSDACLEAAIATRRPAYLNMVVNRGHIRDRPDLVERLASGDHPVSQMAYSYVLTEPRLRRRLLAAARPATLAWTEPDGLVSWLLGRSDLTELRPAVVCAFPDLVRHALITLGPKLAGAEQLRGLLSLYVHAGPAEVLAAVQSAELSADVVKVAREAAGAADGERRLRAAAEEAESTAVLIDELYRVESGKRRPRGGGAKGALLSAADLVNARTDLDWSALLAAHTTRPFSKEKTVLPLVQRSDCPRQMLVALLAAPPSVTSASVWAEEAAVRALGKGLTGSELLDVSRMAKGVLALSLGRDDAPGWAEFRAALKPVVQDRLGTDIPAWHALRARLADHPGTVAELIGESLAAAAPVDPGDPGEPWPDAAGLPDPRRGRGDVPATRAAFLVLLEAARTETQCALLPHLDDMTSYELVVSGSWKPELAEHIVTEGSPRDRLVLARRKGLTPHWVGRLLAWDEPDVNTSLFFQHGATDPQKLAIAAGVPAGAGRSSLLPLPTQLREYMIGKQGHSWTTDFALASGDPGLVRNVLHYAKVDSRVRQLRMFTALWRRSGRDEVRALLAEDFSAVKGQRTKEFEPEVRSLLKDLLALPNETEALEQLRAHTLVTMLRYGSPDENVVAIELPSWDWSTVLAAHRQQPFDPRMLRWLAGRAGCPAALTEGLQSSADEPVGIQPTAASESHSAEPSAPDTSVELDDWARKLAVMPVGEALSHIDPPDEWKQAMADVLAPINGNTEAWVLVLRMLPGFPGSLTELVSTAERALQ